MAKGKIENVMKIYEKIKDKKEINIQELKKIVMEETGTISHISVINYVNALVILEKIRQTKRRCLYEIIS